MMEPCVATVGTFDGVHIGHVAILEKLNSISEEKGCMSRAITFLNHPLSVIAPERAPKWAVDRNITEKALEMLVDRVSEMNFTPQLAAMTAREFMQLLCERFNVTTLVMGYDNTFGSDRLSTREQYEAAGRDAGIEVVFVDAVTMPDGRPASSSRLRKAVAAGNIDEVAALLGHNPGYMATVVEGKHLGRKIGFPTMNLEIDHSIVPPADGVYAVEALVDNPEKSYKGVLSIGNNPTVADGNKKTWELHIPERKFGNMYGKFVSFKLLGKIRGIEKFDSIDMLRKAIKNDIKTLDKYKI